MEFQPYERVKMEPSVQHGCSGGKSQSGGPYLCTSLHTPHPSAQHAQPGHWFGGGCGWGVEGALFMIMCLNPLRVTEDWDS